MVRIGNQSTMCDFNLMHSVKGSDGIKSGTIGSFESFATMATV